jgi:hypothetical protein
MHVCVCVCVCVFVCSGITLERLERFRPNLYTINIKLQLFPSEYSRYALLVIISFKSPRVLYGEPVGNQVQPLLELVCPHDLWDGRDSAELHLTDLAQDLRLLMFQLKVNRISIRRSVRIEVSS